MSKDLELEDFGAADFLDYRPVMAAFLAGIEQFEVDTYDYILSQVDANLLPLFDPNEPPNEKWFIEQALRLRAQRRTEEVTQLLEIGDLEQVRPRLKEKALIQQYRATKR